MSVWLDSEHVSGYHTRGASTSNVLLRLLQRGDPLHTLVRAALRTLRFRGHRLCYTSQILGEFWNVSTRPASARGG